MRSYSRTNETVGLVENLYSIPQQNTEATYQREIESYADANRLFRICSVRKQKTKDSSSSSKCTIIFFFSLKMIVE